MPLAPLVSLSVLLLAPPAVKRLEEAPELRPGDVLPLQAGSRWIYGGRVRWTTGTRVRSRQIRWVSCVLEVRVQGGRTCALVRGFPFDLAWHVPGQAAKDSLVVQEGDRVWVRTWEGEGEARRAMETVLGDPGLEGFDLWLDGPLLKDRCWGPDVRPDGWYGWQVTETFGVSPERQVSLAFVTQPDHTQVELKEGVGITRYCYVHHGTVAEVDVRLVAFRKGKERGGG